MSSSSIIIHLCGTWPFCAEPMTRHSKSVSSSLSNLVINIIEDVELNPNQATVGAPGSLPNQNGIYELDAAWMRTATSIDHHQTNDEDIVIEGESGAILALRGFNGAIRFAQKLAMECPHSILAGIGAREFAQEKMKILCMGDEEANMTMMQKLILNDKKENITVSNDEEKQQHHQDTLGITALRVTAADDKKKKIEIIAAVSTSGLGRKMPGRIGDSPIFGSGLYSDCTIGAATATGDGDAVSLFPICFVAVEEMKRLAAAAAALLPDESKKITSDTTNTKNTNNIVDAACRYAIKKFLANPNVRAFCNGRTRHNGDSSSSIVVKNRLSQGGPLVGLCGVCYYYSSQDDKIVVETGGACCENWTYEYATSHLSVNEDDTKEVEATVRFYK